VRSALILVLGLWLQAAGLQAQSPKPEADTRADLLRQQREEKSKQLAPPDPSRLERILLDLENGRVFERLLNPAEGFYPKVGNVTAGSGIALGPAYRRPGIVDGHADVSAFAIGSFQRYWMLDARLRMPRLARERASIDVHAQRYDFPDEDFFGLGPASRRADHVTFGIRNTVLGATGAVHPRRWLTFGGGFDYLTPRIDAGRDIRPTGSLFDDAAAPGLRAQPDFIRYETFGELNSREPRGNPRRGGRYALTAQHFVDLDDGRHTFQRIEVDLQQYLPLLRDRRVLALHALVSASDADAGRTIPFYLQRTLGGPDDLRGFRRFRFRDANLLLLQAEYRWEIFTAVDGAIFDDAGKVASRLDDVNLQDLESNYGIGFRFGARNGVFLRVEGAFGSSDGKHFIFRFGHVF
jgi:hypothetical protein